MMMMMMMMIEGRREGGTWKDVERNEKLGWR
jgi:hypothetical protein